MDEIGGFKSLIESLQKQVSEAQCRVSTLSTVATEEGLIFDHEENFIGPHQFDGPQMSDLKLMEKLTQWKVLSHTCHTKMLPDGYFLRQWSVTWQLTSASIITIEQNIDERVDGNFDKNSSTVSKLEIRIRLIDEDDDDETGSGLIESETKKLIDFCCEEKNSSAFFIQMTSYQKLYNAREDVIYDLEIERRVGSNKSGKCIFVELKNEAGMLLASFYWWIGFQPEQSGFFESYKVLFTDEGKNACQECNLPQELLNQGHYLNWTPKECLDNLMQISTFT